MLNISKIFKINDYINREIAIDLGSSNTTIAIEGKGIVLCIPTCIAFNNKTKEVVAIGEEAKEMVGKTPSNVSAVYPVQQAVICDFEACELFLKACFSKISTNSFIFDKIASYTIIVGIPTNISEVERRALLQICKNLGARKIYLANQLLLSALGMGLEIEKSGGVLVVNFGGGATSIGVISLASVVIDTSIRVGSSHLDSDLVLYVKNRFGLVIGEKRAEECKKEIANVFDKHSNGDKNKKSEHFEIRGRSIKTGLPELIKLNNLDLSVAYKETLQLIIDSIKKAIEDTPSELISDISQKEIYLCGRGSLLRGLDLLIESEVKIPAKKLDTGSEAVLLGALELFKNRALLARICDI